MKHYTYIHYRNDNGEPFYIGKGVNDRYSRKRRNQFWHRVVKKSGGFRAEIISYWKTNKEALDHEIFLISCFKDMGFQLCNLTNGGEGSSGIKLSDKQKAIISATHKGKVTSDETKAKISASHIGKKASDETKEKMRAAWALRSKDVSIETREKISAAGIGRKFSNESKEKMRAAAIGRKLSDETKEKMRAAKTGKKLSIEHKESLKAAWAKRSQSLK
jgi:hypothetical protein